MRETSQTTCFRLLGESEGGRLSFVLAAGEYLLGTDPTCDIVLPIRGVSRRHARLRVTVAGVEVIDLDSKNGSFINERDGESQLALIGDELRFGPIGLQLQGADPEDARLGLSLDPMSGIVNRAPSLETTWMPGAETPGVSSLGVLEVLLDALLEPPEPDLEAALHALTGPGPVTPGGPVGAALVQWSPGHNALAVASSGEIDEAPELSELPRIEHGSWGAGSWRVQKLPNGTGSVVWLRRAEEAVGLVIWGDIGHIGPQWLVTFARLLSHFSPTQAAGQSTQEDPTPKTAEIRLRPEIVRGRAPTMEALYQQMTFLLGSDVPVLILGETGVGKEHLAQALHDSGPRRSGPFIAVNCAAIPKELLEAEMFGIGKGVATGVEPRRGKFSEAKGGTLFLDEVGEMPADLQAKLLRVLQEKEIHPLGRASEATDVRVLAATNTDLERGMQEGHFRRDLYYRLAGYVLEVPALRERPEDIPLLAGHFLRKFSQETGKRLRGMTVKALRRLADHDWPGNIRELEHAIRRLVFLCAPHQVIDAELVASQIDHGADLLVAQDGDGLAVDSRVDESSSSPRKPAPASPQATEQDLPPQGLEAHLQDIERHCVNQALRRSAGNQSAAARLLKISRNGLAKRIKRLGIDVAEFLP